MLQAQWPADLIAPSQRFIRGLPDECPFTAIVDRFDDSIVLPGLGKEIVGPHGEAVAFDLDVNRPKPAAADVEAVRLAR